MRPAFGSPRPLDKAGSGTGKWQPFEPDKENYLRLQLPADRMSNGQFRRQYHYDFFGMVPDFY